jgi:hypothetical protein
MPLHSLENNKTSNFLPKDNNNYANINNNNINDNEINLNVKKITILMTIFL